jgi:hypothetical protein
MSRIRSRGRGSGITCASQRKPPDTFLQARAEDGGRLYRLDGVKKQSNGFPAGGEVGLTAFADGQVFVKDASLILLQQVERCRLQHLSVRRVVHGHI